MTTNAQIALIAAAVNLPNASATEVKERAMVFVRYLDGSEVRTVRE